MTRQNCADLTTAANHASGPVRWICFVCGVECRFKRVPSYCHDCGTLEGFQPQAVELRGTRGEAVETLEPGVIVPEWAPLLPIGLPRGCSMILRGRPGAGKSRAAFRLATNIGTTMIFALEMGKKLSQHTLIDAGGNNENVWWYEHDCSGIDEVKFIKPKSIVFDSVQKMGRERGRIVTRLRRWALDEGTNLFLISQQNQKGVSRYGEGDDFDCDAVCDVTPCCKDRVPLKNVHGNDDHLTECAPGCAHVALVKSRVSLPGAWDVPIGKGVEARPLVVC